MFHVLGYTLDLQNTNCSTPQMREVDTAETLPMFRTALGKYVPLKESSIAKALSILGSDKIIDSGVFLSPLLLSLISSIAVCAFTYQLVDCAIPFNFQVNYVFFSFQLNRY